MDGSAPQGSNPDFLRLSFDAKWEFLKPDITRLYVDEDKNLSSVANIMKDHYGFDAFKHQYKYQLKKWEVSKNVPGSKKEAAVKAIGKRMREGVSTPAVRYKGEEIDKKRIRRHIKTTARQVDNLQLCNNIFVNWSLPYGALRSASGGAFDHVSPVGPVATTPSDLSVATPRPPVTGQSPGNGASPSNVPSPTVQLVKAKIANDRARLFIQGRYDDLFATMEKHEKKVTTTWLHQFWLFSYKTAKHWGRGPKDWTAGTLSFDSFQDSVIQSSPNTPGAIVGSPLSRQDSQAYMLYESQQHETTKKPSQLCRWSIHVNDNIEYDNIPSPPLSPPAEFDIDNEDSWPSWPVSPDRQTITEKLQSALESNSFSNVVINDLPIATSQIVKAVQRSPKELLGEAFSFCIMARNNNLLVKLLANIECDDVDVSGLFPHHLAITYLDGAKSCCGILDTLLQSLVGTAWINKVYINDHGHTVLDNLMIVVLRAHTSCPPVTVNDNWKKERRFAGEEVDICGRWDADSPCIRALMSNGDAKIPFKWKHAFCHTSAQAICHGIGTLFGPLWAPDINTMSGLFLKLCPHCGRRLQLTPLHSLVLTAFHLARSGCHGETLFGMIACLVCLLVNGADPMMTAHVSLMALLGMDDTTECSHEEIDPAEFAGKVPSNFFSQWTEEVKLGWDTFCRVLQFAQDERRAAHDKEMTSPASDSSSRNSSYDDMSIDDDIHPREEERGRTDDGMSLGEEKVWQNSDDDSDYENECVHEKESGNFYGQSKGLGTLWAAVQTELLTYRRQAEGDPWISKNFNLAHLLDGLEYGYGIRTPLVENKMMKPFCRCGRFLGAGDEACATAPEACDDYFSNLEDWSRSEFLNVPSRADSWYY